MPSGWVTRYAEVTGCALPGTLVAVLPWITPLKSAWRLEYRDTPFVIVAVAIGVFGE